MGFEAIAGAAAPVAGGILGNILAGGDQASAQGALQQALSDIQGVQVPTIGEQELNLAMEQSAGQLTPQALGTVSLGPNALAGITTTPAYSQAQMAALQQLGQLGTGGLTAQERANLIQAQQAAAGTAQAQNAAILQNMAARGLGGSGAQLAAQLSASQAGANQAAQAGQAINAQAQQNALAALSQAGGLAGQMQAQQFGQQAAIAQAQNAINQFNAMNQQNVMGYNVQAQNQAQAANLANLQNIANQNVALQNQQQQYNKALYQQQYQDQMAKAQAAANVLGAQSNYFQNQANATRGMWSGIGSGVGSAFNAYGTQQALQGAFGGGGGANTAGVNFNTTATPANNWGAGSFSMPQMGSSSGYGQSGGYSLGFARGGKIPEISAILGDIKPDSFAHGGMVEGFDPSSDREKCNDENVTFGDIIPAKMAQGGMLNPPDYNKGGMCYDEGGQVVPDELKPFMPTKAEEESSGFPPGPQRAIYIAQRKKRASDLKDLADKGNPGGSDASLQPTYSKGGKVNEEAVSKAMKHPDSPHAGAKARAHLNPASHAAAIMKEFHRGTLYSGSGHKVSDPQQAKAIAMSESGQSKYKNKGGEVSTLGMNSYADGGTVGAPIGYPGADVIVPGVGKMSDALALARGMAGNLQKPNSTRTVTTYPSPMSPEDAAEMALSKEKPVDTSEAAQLSLYDKLRQQVAAQKAARAIGMYEGGNLVGLPHGPEHKSSDSYDAEQSGMKGMSSGGKTGANLGLGMEMFKVGGHVPGKAPVKGDSPKNDIVDAKLSPGEVVIPRSLVNADDDAILNFVHKVRSGKK